LTKYSGACYKKRPRFYHPGEVYHASGFVRVEINRRFGLRSQITMKKMMITASAVALMTMGSAAYAGGQKTYQAACFACHGTGAAGAPKLGDKAAWKDRIAKGMDVLNEHAIKGFKGNTGFMPAKGGRADLSDADVKSAVAYMVAQSK
jgi:cytochrome c5